MAEAPAKLLRQLRNVDPLLVVVCLAVSTTQTAWSIVVPVLPAYTAEFGANATKLGLVVAMFGVGRLIINVPAGILCNRIDPRKLLVTSVVAVVVFQAATAFAPSLQALLALRFGTGLAGGMAITCGMTMIGALTHTTSRGKAMSLLQGAQLLGGTIGPPLGGLVAVLWGPRMPFLVCGSLATLVIVLGWRTLWRASTVPVGSQPAGTAPIGGRRGVFRLLSDRSYLAICAVGFSVFFHRFAGMQSLIPIIAYSVAGLTVGELGLILGIVTACNLVMVSMGGSMSDRIGRKRVIVPGLLVMALALPWYAFAARPAVFVIVTLVTGVAAGFSGPTPAAYVADVAPAEARGPAIGIYRTVGDSAGIAGPILVGWLVDQSGYRASVVVLAAVVLTAVIVFATVARETVPRRVPTTSATAGSPLLLGDSAKPDA